MRFRQPLVLLLGSILSASGIGCSAVTAVISDSRPASRENRGDADRLVAIGRVFENQGRYDKAEAVYRKALRDRPQDSQIRNQLRQLAERRKQREFGPTRRADALAMADAVSSPESGAQQDRRTVTTTPNAATLTALPQTSPAHVPGPVAVPAPGPQPPFQQRSQPVLPQSLHAQAVHTQPLHATESMHRAFPVVTTASLKSDTEPGAALAFDRHPAPVSNRGWHRIESDPVTSEAVMVALEYPDNHVELLLKAMHKGDNNETKTLAATLLGDCDPADSQVRDELVQQQSVQSAPEVLIAICDSQIQRNEANQQTVNCLVCLCTSFSNDVRIQAASQLNIFAGTEYESLCLTALNELLASEDSSVRATAALTLGEFTSIDDSITKRLQNMKHSDSSKNVRNAAESSLNRQESDILQIIPAQSGPSE